MMRVARVWRVFGFLFLFCLSGQLLEGSQERQIRLPKVDLENVTLDEAIDYLRAESRRLSLFETGINFVINTRRMPALARELRFSIEAVDVKFEHVVWAICRRLGIGYRIDRSAVYLSSRKHLGLPTAPTIELRGVKDGAPRGEYYVFLVRAEKG